VVSVEERPGAVEGRPAGFVEVRRVAASVEVLQWVVLVEAARRWVVRRWEAARRWVRLRLLLRARDPTNDKHQ
jgi:hypothetical protein